MSSPLRSVLVAVGALFVAVSAASADPIATVPAPGPLEPGFLVDWVEVAGPAFGPGAPHTIADAEAILAGGGGFTIIDRAQQILPFIDLHDANVPFAGADPVFAVRVSAYLNLAAGTYSFLSFHDDGLKVTVGGDTVINFATDTPTVGTDSPFFTLPAGYYSYEAIGWEQGGVFDLQLGIDAGNGRFFLGDALHPVPEPGTLSLLGAGALGLVRNWRKRRAA